MSTSRTLAQRAKASVSGALEPFPSAFIRRKTGLSSSLQPDPQRDGEQQDRDQEGQPPAPGGERRLAEPVRMPMTTSSAANRPSVAVVWMKLV